MTEARLQSIVIEMVALGDRTRAFEHMNYEVTKQCDWWHFGKKDFQLLSNEIVGRYQHYKKFFDKPNQSGT